jgi:hypothetical protein
MTTIVAHRQWSGRLLTISTMSIHHLAVADVSRTLTIVRRMISATIHALWSAFIGAILSFALGVTVLWIVILVAFDASELSGFNKGAMKKVLVFSNEI